MLFFRTGRAIVLVASSSAVVAQVLNCWHGLFTFDRCCDLRQGPSGNEACWQVPYNFSTCCEEQAQSSAGGDRAAAMRQSLPKAWRERLRPGITLNWFTLRAGLVCDAQRDVVIKFLPKTALYSSGESSWRRELAFLEGVSHSNVIQLHDQCEVWLDGAINVAVLLESAATDLRTLIYKNNMFGDGPLQALLFYGAVHAVADLHSAGIAHRDLKLKNIVVTRLWSTCARDPAVCHAKLIDFELACFEGTSECLDPKSPRGTTDYMSPELFEGEQVRGQRSDDLWALGVILHELVHGTLPSGDWAPFLSDLKRRHFSSWAGCFAFCDREHFLPGVEQLKAFRYKPWKFKVCSSDSPCERLLSGLLVPKNSRLSAEDAKRIAWEWLREAMSGSNISLQEEIAPTVASLPSCWR